MTMLTISNFSHAHYLLMQHYNHHLPNQLDTQVIAIHTFLVSFSHLGRMLWGICTRSNCTNAEFPYRPARVDWTRHRW